MFRNIKFVSLILILALVNVTAVFAAAPGQQEDQTIVDLAVADGRFTTLVDALTTAELVETLSGEGPFTVFAPTDEAFAALPEGELEELLADPDALTDVLLYHVVGDEVLAADVVALSSADTLLGEPVTITVDGETVLINEATVIETDLQGTNGVIHVIDAVLLPSTGDVAGVDTPSDVGATEIEEDEAAPAEGEAATGEGEAVTDEGEAATDEGEAAPAEGEVTAEEPAGDEAPATLPQSGGQTSSTTFTILIISILGVALLGGGVILRLRSTQSR